MNFERLSAEECALFERIGVQKEYAPRQSVYSKGETDQALYYIKKGRIRIYETMPSGREITVDVIEAGYIVGESAFCGIVERPINVQAINEVILIAIPVERLVKELQTQPTLALHLLQMCSDSMDRLMNRVEEQCLLDRYGKIASYLLDVTAVESMERGTIGGVVPYTHSNLADYLGLNRTTVTAVLKYFDQKKWISCGYGQIRVLKRESLQEFVNAQRS